MSPLDRKMTREVWQMKGQSLAIALVLAAGVAMYVMSISNYHSLDQAKTDYYQDRRFADVFASVKRAPRSLEDRIREIPGVARVQTRIVRDVNLDMPQVDGVATARLVSIPVPYRPALNEVHIREGRYPSPGSESEILISEPFALANDLHAGARIPAVINGRLRELEVVGVALSPEFIFTIKSGSVFPDDKRYGVFWIGEKALEAAFNMEGAFNDVSLRLSHDASVDEAMTRLDLILEPYGGLDAVARKDQVSNWFLSSELEQLQHMGFIIPAIFFSVAVFLLNLVLTRLIKTQRGQIGLLKAFGYTRWQVGLHYLKFVILIVCLGTVLGSAGGAYLGSGLAELYTEYYKFPRLDYILRPSVIAAAFLFTLAVSALGAWSAVRRAMDLPPAEAMRPEPPASFKPTLIERIGLKRFMTPQLGMVLRNMERQPLRTGLSTLGLAMAVGLMVLGRYNVDAIFRLMDVQFNWVQRYDVQTAFYEGHAYRAFHELASLDGVLDAEPVRMVPARLRHENHSRRIGIIGLPGEPRLQRPLDRNLDLIPLPLNGLAIERKLASTLDVVPGDRLLVEMLEGDRPKLEAQVTRLVDEYFGSNVYMNFEALNRLMGDDRVVSGAYLRVDDRKRDEIFTRLKNTPAIAGVSVKQAELDSFRDTMARNMLMMNFFNVLFSFIIAFGVVYNSAQMILNERSRDLGTLRVIGFTRAEISTILLGELAMITLAAIPLGFAIGYGLSYMTASMFQTELFRMPFYLSRQTFGIAALTIMISSLISGLVVRRKLDRLDLMAVLKTRE